MVREREGRCGVGVGAQRGGGVRWPVSSELRYNTIPTVGSNLVMTTLLYVCYNDASLFHLVLSCTEGWMQQSGHTNYLESTFAAF